jgi:hypothetical protein
MHTYRICQVKPYIHSLPHMVTSLCVLFKHYYGLFHLLDKQVATIYWLHLIFLFFGGQVSVLMNQQVREAHTQRGNLNHCLENWLHCGKGLGGTHYHLTEWQLVRSSCLTFTVDMASSIVHSIIS